MHKQLPAIILAIVIISAVIGAVIIFKAPSYGKAATMPQTISQRLPSTTQIPVTRTAPQPIATTTVSQTATAARTVTTAPRRVQASELTSDFYNKLSLECQQKTKKLYVELLKRAESSGRITGMQFGDPFKSPLFDQKIISTITLVEVELQPGTTLAFGCGADIGLQDLMSGNFEKGTYGISIDLIGVFG